MLPIVATLLGTLAQNGLGLLSSAIQAKGKEVVENTLGVKIPDAPTPEDVTKLRELQFAHEERLIELSIEKAKQELEEFKTEITDREGARTRDVAYVQAGLRNIRADLMFVLALVVICWLVYIVWKDQSISEYVKGIFTLVLGRFLGYLDNIYNFEFGTTRGSRDKDATIKNMTESAK
jgi:hypothetical protein